MVQKSEVQAPWREVAYIETRPTRRGGFMWTLTLACEHWAFRYAANPQWKLFKPPAIAPKKVRCLPCKLAIEEEHRNPTGLYWCATCEKPADYSSVPSHAVYGHVVVPGRNVGLGHLSRILKK